MSYFSKSIVAGVAFTIWASAPAYAQSLAESVVEEYFAQAEQNGVTVSTGAKSVSGSTVEWTDIIFAFPDDGGWIKIPFLRAEEIGGDQVSMSYPDEMKLFVKPSADFPGLDATIGFEGVNHIVSGTAEARNQEFSADLISIQSVDDDQAPLLIDIELAGVSSSQVTTMSDIGHYNGVFSADQISVAYGITNADVNMSMDSSFADFSGQIDIDMVSGENFEDFLTGKRSLAVSYTVGAGNSEISSESPDFSGTITHSASGGSGSLALQEGTFAMQGQASDIDYNLKFSKLPFPPFQASLASLTFQFGMPLKRVEEILPANVLMNIDGLKLSDTIWGMVDPAGSIPRDAAMLNIDVTAQMKWLVDLIEAKNAKQPPIEVESVSINDLTLTVAGASFNGVGNATLDNTKMPPEPVGEINLNLTGGIGLLDKIVGLGFVPAGQAQMFKGMAGMFTVPGGNGEDNLISKIEMKEGGSIFANGQQIK